MNELETLLEPLVESAPAPPPVATVRERAARFRRQRRARSGGLAVLVVTAVVAGVVIAVPRNRHDVRTIAPPSTTSAPRPLRVGTPHPFDRFGIDLIAAYGSLWLSQADRVARIDPADGKVLATIRVPGSSDERNLAAGAGSIWVDDTGTAAVTRIDSRTDRVVATIPLLQGQYDPDGIAFVDGFLWVARPQPEGPDGDVVAIDPATNRVARRTSVARTFGIRAGAGVLWYQPDAATFSGSDLVRLDPRTLRTTIVRRDSVRAIVAFSGRGIWVQTDRGVVELDQRTGAQIGGAIQPRGTVNVVAAVADGVLWLAAQPGSSAPGLLVPYDVVTHRVLGSAIPLGLPILDLVPTPGAIWTTVYQRQGLTRIPYSR